MNLLKLMPKLGPETIRTIARRKNIPESAVPLVKLEDAVAIIGTPRIDPCSCGVCRGGGNLIRKTWRSFNK